MAFCNSCGANLDPATRFCNKCGAAVAAPAAPSTVVPAAAPVSGTVAAGAGAPASSGGGALKVILIVVAVIVGIGMLGIGTVVFVGYRIAKSSHVRQEGDNVKVETPFGTVESSKNPEVVAQELGVEVYPGAKVEKGSGASATVFGMHTASASFESGDSLDKVSAFYKAKFPNAMVTTSDEGHCTIVSNDKKNIVTINIEAEGDGTKIQITNVTGKPGAPGSSSN